MAKSKPGMKASPSPTARVSTSALAVARILAEKLGPQAEWPDGGWAMIRGLTIQLHYEAFARAYGMRVTPVREAMPEACEALTLAERQIAELLPDLTELTPEHFGHVHETLVGHELLGREVVPSNGRRRSGAHFTPPDLAYKVALRTLEPLFEIVPAERTLELRVCDPAVGAGAFLLAVVRIVGTRVLKAGRASCIEAGKRLAAIHCAYGVDKDRYAVHAAKLALTLDCRAEGMGADWLDDNIKHGDALTGLTNEQIGEFSWRREKQASLAQTSFAPFVRDAMEQAATRRQARIAELVRREGACQQ